MLKLSSKMFFLASDVGKGLGYSSAAAMTRTLDDDEKDTQIVCTPCYIPVKEEEPPPPGRPRTAL